MGAAQDTEPGPPVPRVVGESVVAPGRVLGWAEFGHPDGDPLLWFHGTPGARTQIPPAVHEVALQRGFRVIGVERPGTGRSTDHFYDRILDVAADIEALVEDLGLERFGVVGLSGGGPYTLAVAYAMPQQVVVACTLGGIGPLRGPDAVWSYMRVLRFGAPLFEVMRGPVGSLLGTLVGYAESVGGQALELFARLVGGSDREVLTNPHFKAMFVTDLIEAGEHRAVAHDLALFSRHWGFLLEEVTVPVIVWQGLSDPIVPQSHGHHMAARLPNAQLRVRPGEGHFAGFSDVAAVLDSVREVWAFQTAEPVRRG
jgi:pimeloyl-ACP methyl ester carboxylesterase